MPFYHFNTGHSYVVFNSCLKFSSKYHIKSINVTSFSVFHTEATVSIGLKNVLRMVTSILQNCLAHVSIFYLGNPVSQQGSLEYKQEVKIPYPTKNGERT